ncbi:MAG: transposase [Clostridiales bacterium]|nr:transposase [Clostridiales bacterium]
MKSEKLKNLGNEKTTLYTRASYKDFRRNCPKKGGYQEVLKISLEAMMRAEREEHNLIHGDMSNGFRVRKTFGQGKILELKVPRSRQGHFYPLLLGLLRDQEEECRRNVQKRIKPKDKAQVVEDFREVFRCGDRHDDKTKGWERWVSFCQK